MDNHADPSFQELVADCAERLDRDGEPALHDYCARFPQHADALRAAMAPLVDFGLAGPATRAPAPDPQRLGEFELVREIGRGGMGVVYEARQASLGRTVAVKVLPRQWVQDRKQVVRFQNEARAAATLDHPHIVPVFVIGEEAGTHYYAMQLIAGTSVRRLLARLRHPEPADDATAAVLANLLPARGRTQADPGPEPERKTQPAGSETLPRSSGGATSKDTKSSPRLSGSVSTSDAAWLRRIAELARQAATALDKAHAAGILHRDIKPGNLLVDPSGHLWVTDFGLAHFVREGSDLTRSGEFIGTIAYSSPEQAGGRIAVDARSDVYSLGATLYEMVCLKAPFAAKDAAALAHQVLTHEPRALRGVDPRVPRDLETIVHKAMAKEPGSRYQTAAELATDLQAFIDGRPIAARPTTRVQRGLRWCRRNPFMTAALACIVLLLLVAGGVGWAGLEVAHERDRALSAERQLTRVSTRRKIDGIRTQVEAERRSLALGARAASLQKLAEARAEVDVATANAADRAELLFHLRSDACAALASWDAVAEPLTGTECARPLAFDATFALCAAQDGDDLVVAERSGRVLARLPDLGKHASAGFAPDGEWIVVTAINVRRLRVWHWRSGRVIDGQDADVDPPASWTSDGRTLLACARDPLRAVACDLATGTWRDVGRPFVSVELSPWSVTPSPDRKRIAACIGGRDALFVVDADDPKAAVRVIPLPMSPFQLAWDEDGRRVTVGGEMGLMRIDVTTGTVLTTWSGHRAEVGYLARDAGSRLVASRSWDGQVRLWDTTGRCLLAIDNQRLTHGIMFSADGRHIGWQRLIGPDGAPAGARHWRLAPPSVVRDAFVEPTLRAGPHLAFHPRLPLLALSGNDGIVFLDADTGAQLEMLSMALPSTLTFVDDDWLFVESLRDPPRLVKVDTSRPPLVRVGKPRRLTAAGDCDTAAADGNLICAWLQDKLRVISLPNRLVRTLDVPLLQLPALTLMPGGSHVAAGTFGGDAATVVDLATGRTVLTVPAQDRESMTCFSPDGRLLLVTGRHLHRVFETKAWRPVANIPRPQPDARAGAGAFTPDGGLLAVATARTRLRLLDTASWQPILEIDMPDDWSAGPPCFSPDGARMAIATRVGRVLLWDLHAMRRGLREIGLDWSDAAIPPAAPAREPVRVEIEK